MSTVAFALILIAGAMLVALAYVLGYDTGRRRERLRTRALTEFAAWSFSLLHRNAPSDVIIRLRLRGTDQYDAAAQFQPSQAPDARMTIFRAGPTPPSARDEESTR